MYLQYKTLWVMLEKVHRTRSLEDAIAVMVGAIVFDCNGRL